MLSWADKIRAAQEEQAAKVAAGEQLPVSAPQVVVAPMSGSAGAAAAPVSHHVTTSGVERLRQSSKGLLVLDTNAFLQGISHLMNEADVFVTTPQVLQECKDARTREYLERLPFQLDVIDPQPESIQEVMDVAAKTGDLGALSRTDIRLCALALECARHVDAMKPAIEPRAAVLNDGVNGVTIDAEERSESEEEGEESDDEEEEEEAAPAAAAAKPAADDRDAELPGWGNFDDSWGDDDGEVLNVAPMPGTAKAHAAAVAARNAPPRPAVDPRLTVPDFYAGGFACITSDFPMQNTLLHLGVPVLGARGGRITQLRVWLLRCHACFHLVHDTTRQFCPECGSGDTLKRVSYVVHEDGTKKLFINFRHHISTRGTIYNLPKPRGGRNGTNKRLVLREDQLKNCGRVDRKAAVQRVAASDLDGFAEHRPSVQRSGDNLRVKSSYSRRNINEVRKARAARHK